MNIFDTSKCKAMLTQYFFDAIIMTEFHLKTSLTLVVYTYVHVVYIKHILWDECHPSIGDLLTCQLRTYHICMFICVTTPADNHT